MNTKEKIQMLLDKVKARHDSQIKKSKKATENFQNSVNGLKNDNGKELKKVLLGRCAREALKNDGILSIPEEAGNIIPDFAFKGNEHIRKVIIPENVNKIGIGAFSGCINLKDITIKSKEIYISDEAFKETSVFKLIVENAYIGKSAFEDSGIITFQVNGNCIIDDDAFSNSNLSKIVQTNDGGIISIGEGSFYKCENLTNFYCSKKLKSIGKEAFSGCTSLERVAFLEKSEVAVLEEKTFYNCAKLEEIYFCKIIEIQESCFEGCKMLGITVNNLFTENLQIIRKSAFKGCSEIESMNLENCKVVESSAFYGCNSLKNVQMKSMLKIGKIAFALSGIEKVYCENILIISDGAFCECKNLKTVYLGEKLEKIGNCCFKNSTKLTEIAIESRKLMQLPDSICEGCAGLSRFAVNSDEIKKIGMNSFRECGKLQSINSFPQIEAINEMAFYRCFMLNKFNFYGATYIGCSAFESTAIEKVRINSVAVIKGNAFSGCYNLQEIAIKSGSILGANAIETEPQKKIYFI